MATYIVYILKNTASNKHYIGSTNDLERRLSEHNRGQTKSTRGRGTWKVIYSEEFISNKEAKQRERQIKSYKSGNAFRNLVQIVQR